MTERQISVSVVLTTFNGARFLSEQLASLAAQTHRPRELIVADDGSADDTLAIVERFAREAAFPVQIHRNPVRLGYGENFLQAAKRASGDLIAFCDQDDVWRPDKLAAAVESLRSAGALLHVHAAALIDDAGRSLGEFDQGIRRRTVCEPLELAPWGVFYGFSMTFRRELLELIDPAERGGHIFEFEGPLSHDLWVYFLAGSLGRVVLDDRRLADYRQHRANQTPHVAAGLRAWLRTAGVPAHPRLRRDEIARHRAALLRALQARASEPALREAAGKAADYWEGIARYEELRLDVYAPDRPDRIQQLMKLAGLGAYRPHRRGGLGRRLLLKDLLFLGLRGQQIRAWAE